MRTENTVFRLHGCTGLSEDLLAAYTLRTKPFSGDLDQTEESKVNPFPNWVAFYYRLSCIYQMDRRRCRLSGNETFNIISVYNGTSESNLSLSEMFPINSRDNSKGLYVCIYDTPILMLVLCQFFSV